MPWQALIELDRALLPQDQQEGRQDSGLIHSVVTSAANVPDLTPAAEFRVAMRPTGQTPSSVGYA